ncbi:MAG: hypothetical protein ACP5IO_06900 [Elusimicrobiales bacterium]
MIIEIYTVDSFDVESRKIYKMWKGLEVQSKKRLPLKISRLYDIRKLEDERYLHKIAKEILVDPIVEEYVIREKDNFFEENYKYACEIFLKDGVSDVVGESVSDIIEKMYSKKFTVRTGRCFYLTFLDDFVDFVKEEYFNELINKINLRKL